MEENNKEQEDGKFKLIDTGKVAFVINYLEKLIREHKIILSLSTALLTYLYNIIKYYYAQGYSNYYGMNSILDVDEQSFIFEIVTIFIIVVGIRCIMDLWIYLFGEKEERAILMFNLIVIASVICQDNYSCQMS